MFFQNVIPKYIFLVFFAGTTKTKVDICRLPDVLVIHMKRFVYTMYVRGKLKNLVHYPTKGLNMNQFLTSTTCTTKSKTENYNNTERKSEEGDYSEDVDGGDSDANVYDLYAVVHHVGTMNGGHYVARYVCCFLFVFFYFVVFFMFMCCVFFFA